MNATDILNNTRNTIISNIIDLVRKISAFAATGDKMLKVAKDEEAILDATNFPIDRMPIIEAEVWDTYTDDYYSDEQRITEIAASDSGLCITAKSVFSDETDVVELDDISTDDLARIAEFLETEYRKM